MVKVLFSDEFTPAGSGHPPGGSGQEARSRHRFAFIRSSLPYEYYTTATLLHCLVLPAPKHRFGGISGAAQHNSLRPNMPGARLSFPA
jgi:hypothetical protein